MKVEPCVCADAIAITSKWSTSKENYCSIGGNYYDCVVECIGHVQCISGTKGHALGSYWNWNSPCDNDRTGVDIIKAFTRKLL